MPNPFSSEPIADDTPNVSLNDLVGEGQKYKTADELAKAYVHADSFIERSKAERAQIEAELKVYKDLAEARSTNAPTPTPTPPVAPNPPEENKTVEPKVDLNELVRKELDSARAEETRVANINRAAEALNAHFGSPAKAQEALATKARELGVDVDWLRSVAERSPAALLTTIGVSANARPQATPGYSPDVTLPSSNLAGKNFQYYENLRKTSPKTYYSAETRKQMFDNARELGDKFYST